MKRDPGGKRKGISLTKAIQWAVAIAVIVAVFVFVLPSVVDYDEVWDAIGAMTWLELATLGLLAVWNQATYVLVERSARPELTYLQALTITQTSTALANTMPAGAALGAGLQGTMYVSYGFAPSDIGISMALTGIWNTFVKLGMPIIALSLLVVAGEPEGALVGASLFGLAALAAAILAFTILLRSERGAARVGRGLGRIAELAARATKRSTDRDWSGTAIDFRRRTIDLLRSRWPVLTLWTLVSHLTLFVVLLMSLRHVGISSNMVGNEEALAAFAFVRLLSALPITPGGLGVVELGLTASLVAAGGDDAKVVAAVLVYRLLTFVLPIPFGAITYFVWRGQAAKRTTGRAPTEAA